MVVRCNLHLTGTSVKGEAMNQRIEPLPCFHCGEAASRVYFIRRSYPPHVKLSAEDPRLSCETCWKRMARPSACTVGTWPFTVIAQWTRQQLGYVTSPKFSEYNHFHLSEQWEKRLNHIWYRYRKTGKPDVISSAIP